LKVTLRKVTKIPLDFKIEVDEITFKGYFEYHTGKLILLKAVLSGFLDKQCDSCGEEFKMSLDEDVKFYISDGIFEDENGIELDVVESYDGFVEVEELLNSELELIKSDYHSCESCKNKI
jgi:hypothetical protein